MRCCWGDSRWTLVTVLSSALSSLAFWEIDGQDYPNDYDDWVGSDYGDQRMEQHKERLLLPRWNGQGWEEEYWEDAEAQENNEDHYDYWHQWREEYWNDAEEQQNNQDHYDYWHQWREKSSTDWGPDSVDNAAGPDMIVEQTGEASFVIHVTHNSTNAREEAAGAGTNGLTHSDVDNLNTIVVIAGNLLFVGMLLWVAYKLRMRCSQQQQVQVAPGFPYEVRPSDAQESASQWSSAGPCLLTAKVAREMEEARATLASILEGGDGSPGRIQDTIEKCKKAGLPKSEILAAERKLEELQGEGPKRLPSSLQGWAVTHVTDSAELQDLKRLMYVSDPHNLGKGRDVKEKEQYRRVRK